MIEPRRLLDWMTARREAMVEQLTELARLETPAREPGRVSAALVRFGEALEGLGLCARHHAGRSTGGWLIGRPRPTRAPYQLVLGHMDTVWPAGTIDAMPLDRRDGALSGPGTFDMKGGLVQLRFALQALREHEVPMAVHPVVLVNADEEIGSPESARAVARLARGACRALVLEPSLGPTGRLKTARKGLGRFTVVVGGRAAHAGLDPGAGASAILELSHQVQALFALNDPERGVTVNVGTIDGGLQPNVVAPEARAVVDVRAPSLEAARGLDAAIRALRPVTPGTTVTITGGFGRPPMERTAASQRLFALARELGAELGLDLDQASVGGGSDGNTTAQYTPTLDGLGPVGGGAHSADEHVTVTALPERAALLALLLAAPDVEASRDRIDVEAS